MGIQKIQQLPPRAMPVLLNSQGKPVDGIFSLAWAGWFQKLAGVLNGNLATGYSGTVSLAELTVGGTTGSIQVTNGIITAVVEPT